MGRYAQLGRKYKNADDVAMVLVSLDRDKARAANFARKYGPGWTALCDYKVYKTRPANAYAITGVPNTFIMDATGLIRQGPGFGWETKVLIEDLRLEAFYKKLRKESGTTVRNEKAESPKSKSPRAAIRWIFHLESGGRLRVVSYKEENGKYALKLSAGSTTIDKDFVSRIEPVKPE